MLQATPICPGCAPRRPPRPRPSLAHEIAADTPTTPDTATLRAVADHLDHVIAHAEPEQAKALLAILIADLRINSRTEVLPTYRVGAPVVCARASSVGETALCANHALLAE